MLYQIVLHIHSIYRWVLIVAFIAALIESYKAMKTKPNKLNYYNRLLFYSMNGMFLLGLILYFISPKVVFASESMKHDMTRFFLLEHITMMVIAIGIFSISYGKWKRSDKGSKAGKRSFIFILITLAIILLAIPWPFRENLMGGWF